jgi:hypothetical protein
MGNGGILRVSSISFSYTRKFNLGDYEAVEIGVTQWAQVDEDEDADGCIQFLAEQCKNHVKSNIPPNYKSKSPPVTAYTKHTISGIEVTDGDY